MALDAQHYLHALQNILLKGKAWIRDESSRITQLLTGIAQEFARIDTRIDQVLDEADPRTTVELLDNWEAFAGLPDPCVVTDQSYQQRIAALVAKLLMLGGQSRQYFIDIAMNLGYTGITVNPLDPMRCSDPCTDSLLGEKIHLPWIDEFLPMTCNDTCNDALNSADDVFVWQFNLPDDNATYVMTCNDPCDDALQSWGDEVIECRINQYKPAHTTVIFAYR
jgi:uncharacterized protein YmfQ (DUF2313 family)